MSHHLEDMETALDLSLNKVIGMKKNSTHENSELEEDEFLDAEVERFMSDRNLKEMELAFEDQPVVTSNNFAKTKNSDDINDIIDSNTPQENLDLILRLLGIQTSVKTDVSSKDSVEPETTTANPKVTSPCKDVVTFSFTKQLGRNF